jgi:tryptophan-rich sensory protein
MLALKYLLLAGAIGMFLAALSVVAHDLYVEMKVRHNQPPRWRTPVALVTVAWTPLLIALSVGLRVIIRAIS